MLRLRETGELNFKNRSLDVLSNHCDSADGDN